MTKMRVALGVVSLAVAVSSTAVVATEPTAPAEFAIPPERFTALDEAGLGWMFDGVEYPVQPDGVPWPTQEWPTGDLPEGVDEAALQAAIDAAFAPREGTGGVEAILAVHGGELVVEEYNNWDPAAPHPSWSMAKSMTQAMLGILVAEGRLDVFAPAPVPEWTDPADERHAITTDDLLHMRSCLEWQEEYAGESDVITMLFGDGRADRAHFAADRPLGCEPGSTWYYSTGTAMILARIIADQVGYGDEGTAWAQEALFDPIGVTSVSHDLDGIGVMSGGSHIDMTAQDFARFGLLYLRGGEWDGAQIVPEAWVDYARLPYPDAPGYGAQWWLGVDETQDVWFGANGFGGQSITIIPELDLVVVVLANVQDASADDASRGVIDAFADVS
jgi:CubicO group peptidase (beta-lactamase class C family)